MQSTNAGTTTPAAPHESGSVVLIALIMLVLLTVIGISASKTSEIEIIIAGNERVAKENFYLAEGAVRRAVMAMDNRDLKNDAPSWVYKEIDPSDTSKAEYEDIPNEINVLPASRQAKHTGSYGFRDVEALIHEADNWDDTYSQLLAEMDGARCLSLKRGLATKTSAKATGSLPWDFAVYGRSVYKNGLGLVAVGYRKAY